MKKEALKLFDTVAMLKDIPENKVVKGQVGTIVEEHRNGVFEVEFADKDGQTIASFAVNEAELMLLHFEMEYAR
jgi:hypothetical protein